MKQSVKTFIIDTNVLLHDYQCVYNFEENNVVIPIVVLEELDKFKRGNELINFQARGFIRELDKILGDRMFNGGLSLGDDKGTLKIETCKAFSKELRESFPEDTVDNRILAIADHYSRKLQKDNVVLISKDINLRMKAKSIGILAQDYRNDKIYNIDEIYKRGISYCENFDNTLISRLYKEKEGIPVQEFQFDFPLLDHQYFVLRNQKSSALAHYDPQKEMVNLVVKQKCLNIEPRNAEQTFALDALLRPDIELVTLTGKAGTGKTLLALVAALQQQEQYNQIFLARPIVPLANRDIGFLPGNVGEKISPYMEPLYDNLAIIKNQYKKNSKEYKRIEELQEKEKLIITPLSYIRGRSLANIFFIIDEAQNLTPHEIKTIITRAGEDTKMVFTGDIEQIDSPYLDTHSNGLSYLTHKMKGQRIFSHVHLLKGERSSLSKLASDLL